MVSSCSNSIIKNNEDKIVVKDIYIDNKSNQNNTEISADDKFKENLNNESINDKDISNEDINENIDAEDVELDNVGDLFEDF